MADRAPIEPSMFLTPHQAEVICILRKEGFTIHTLRTFVPWFLFPEDNWAQRAVHELVNQGMIDMVRCPKSEKHVLGWADNLPYRLRLNWRGELAYQLWWEARRYRAKAKAEAVNGQKSDHPVDLNRQQPGADMERADVADQP